MWHNGLGQIKTDELHAYEEGINAVAQSMQIDWGNPTAIERGMEVARAYPRLIERNSAGHFHIVSSYYSGSDIVREDGMGVQKPVSLLVTHPGLLLVNYNQNPATRDLLLKLMDGWLAHQTHSDKGAVRFPNTIDWLSDQSSGTGVEGAAHNFWAAYEWSEDLKYLKPIDAFVNEANLSALTGLNADLMTRLPQAAGLKAKLAAQKGTPVSGANDPNLGGLSSQDFTQYVRFQETGDLKIIEDLFGREIKANTRRMPVLTTLEAWVDRVSLPNELLQRSRLGGVALRRNAYYPGHLVSWRFSAGTKAIEATKIALLIPKGDPNRFEIMAFNMTTQPVNAHMTGAQLTGGTWRISDCIKEGHSLKPIPQYRTLRLERGRTISLVIPPRLECRFKLELIEKADDPSLRPDIGISADDLKLDHNDLIVRIHSLGSKPTPKGRIVVRNVLGKIVAEGRFEALEAPLDLLPKTKDVRLSLPTNHQTLTVSLLLDGAIDEISLNNNTAILVRH